MSKELRKKITIASTCQINIYGGTFGPIRSPYYETIHNIGRLIADGIEVYEETPEGRVRLTTTNFDKKEKVMQRKVEAEDVQSNTVNQEAQRVQAQQESRAQMEKQRRQQQYDNQHKKSNNNNQPQQQVKKVDVVVEE